MFEITKTDLPITCKFYLSLCHLWSFFSFLFEIQHLLYINITEIFVYHFIYFCLQALSPCMWEGWLFIYFFKNQVSSIHFFVYHKTLKIFLQFVILSGQVQAGVLINETGAPHWWARAVGGAARVWSETYTLQEFYYIFRGGDLC